MYILLDLLIDWHAYLYLSLNLWPEHTFMFFIFINKVKLPSIKVIKRFIFKFKTYKNAYIFKSSVFVPCLNAPLLVSPVCFPQSTIQMQFERIPYWGKTMHALTIHQTTQFHYYYEINTVKLRGGTVLSML